MKKILRLSLLLLVLALGIGGVGAYWAWTEVPPEPQMVEQDLEFPAQKG